MSRRDGTPAMIRSAVPFGPTELAWLMDLIDVPSVSPLEGGDARETRRAQEVVAAGAAALGFRTVSSSSPDPDSLDDGVVPQPVRDAAGDDREAFLEAQPSLVMRMGRPQHPRRRLVVNFHVDTVGPHVPASLDGGVLRGRGVVDDKGPGVAAAAGIAAAYAEEPWLEDELEVLLCSVPGEEGGAMGSYATRHLVDSGVVGRLMVFAEPTGGRVMDACTAAMTPRLRVFGSDSTDDHPQGAHNATIALGFLADFLARRLGPVARSQDAKLCVAGMHTGDAHNRAYGTGDLLLNIAYPDTTVADRLADDLVDLLGQAKEEFAQHHSDNPLTARLVDDWDEVVELEWLKRGLPVLDNRDAVLEELLAESGFPRHDGRSDGSAFTCDAIWASGEGRYVAVCGPGRLDDNGAHTPDEWVDVSDLADYARRIKDLVVRFGAHVTEEDR